MVKGITGFGFALISIPILSLIFPMSMLVPAMALFNLVTSIYILIGLKVKIKWYAVAPMFVASLGGIPIGVYLLEYIKEDTLKIIAGIMVIIFSLSLLRGNRLAKRFLNAPVVFAGFVSGLLTGCTSIGGPPLVIAMNRKGYSKEVFRAIFSWFTVLSTSFAITAFYLKGLLTTNAVQLAVFSLPLLVIGTAWGSKVAKRIKQKQFRKLVIILNICSGIVIVVTTLIKGH